MLLSWAGSSVLPPLPRGQDMPKQTVDHRKKLDTLRGLTAEALQALHREGYIHGDAAPRNITWYSPDHHRSYYRLIDGKATTTTGKIMFVDLEHARSRSSVTRRRDKKRGGANNSGHKSTAAAMPSAPPSRKGSAPTVSTRKRKRANDEGAAGGGLGKNQASAGSVVPAGEEMGDGNITDTQRTKGIESKQQATIAWEKTCAKEMDRCLRKLGQVYKERFMGTSR